MKKRAICGTDRAGGVLDVGRSAQRERASAGRADPAVVCEYAGAIQRERLAGGVRTCDPIRLNEQSQPVVSDLAVPLNRPVGDRENNTRRGLIEVTVTEVHHSPAGECAAALKNHTVPADDGEIAAGLVVGVNVSTAVQGRCRRCRRHVVGRVVLAVAHPTLAQGLTDVRLRSRDRDHHEQKDDRAQGDENGTAEERICLHGMNGVARGVRKDRNAPARMAGAGEFVWLEPWAKTFHVLPGNAESRTETGHRFDDFSFEQLLELGTQRWLARRAEGSPAPWKASKSGFSFPYRSQG